MNKFIDALKCYLTMHRFDKDCASKEYWICTRCGKKITWAA